MCQYKDKGIKTPSSLGKLLYVMISVFILLVVFMSNNGIVDGFQTSPD